MRTSQSGRNFIKRWEGEKLKPYRDVAGFWTIGVGHLINETTEAHLLNPEGITAEQSDALLATDLYNTEHYVRTMVDVPLQQHQFDALVSLIFNIGPGNFQGSTVRRRINSGDTPENISEAWKRYNKAGGQVIMGLINRREAEVDLFNAANYGGKKKLYLILLLVSLVITGIILWKTFK